MWIDKVNLEKYMPRPARLDLLYETAKQLVLETKNSTISLIQRRLPFNYTRAVGLIEGMEGEIVTAKDESGVRKMLAGITAEYENLAYWTKSTGWVWDGNEMQEGCRTLLLAVLANAVQV
jgi:hypothetical protein